MPLKINGSSSGYTEIKAADAAANNTLTLPSASGTIVAADSSGAAGVTTLNASGNITSGGTVVMASSFLRNRIINGDMRIDQRNAGAALTNNTVSYIIDRFNFDPSKTSGAVVSRQRSTVAPPGFTNSIGCTITTGGTPTATQAASLTQPIEGYNIADLALGTASAKSFTLSFWARSSVTGTHSGVISNAGFNRVYAFTYSLSSADTWTYITVTFPGETTGTWNTDNTVGMYVSFNYGSGSSRLVSPGSWLSSPGAAYGATGSVQLINTTGATFYITGVQLEEGATATPFERRSYGQELALCQRYYETGKFGLDAYNTAGAPQSVYTTFQVYKRAAPTISSTFGYSNCSGGVTDNISPSNFRSYALTTVSGGVAWTNTWTAAAEL